MTHRLAVVLSLLAVSGCNCFVPVEECVGRRCTLFPDGGKRDGGVNDAGRPTDGGSDAGPTLDAGAALVCAVWDGGGVGKCAALTGYVSMGNVCRGECVIYPIETPGVFPTLGACASCGCDVTKFRSAAGTPFTPDTYCDELAALTSLPRLLDEAFGGPDSGFDAGCVPMGALDNSCRLWTRTLTDAGYARACAATLVPYVTEVQCRIFF